MTDDRLHHTNVCVITSAKDDDVIIFCLLATLCKKFGTDLHEIFWPMNEWLNFGGDPDRNTGKTCLGRGMHCPNAISYYYHRYNRHHRDYTTYHPQMHWCSMWFDSAEKSCFRT